MSGAPIGRRGILGGGLALAACGRAPAFIRRDAARPLIPEGALAGDVGEDSALIWSRCDRQATMVVEWSAGSARGRVYGPSVGPASDFAGTTMLRDLPAGAAVEYRVRFLAEDGRTRSAPVEGLLRTAPVGGQPLRILWSGDTCGQGYGIDAARGGLQTYAAMLARAPDLFVHCGDLIYADNPIPATIKLADGTEWRNQTMAGREKVAETIDEFRAAYRYNLLDEHYARFHRTVATIFAWDDHEVLNNWYPGEILGDDEPRYQVREVDVLAARGRQAFREHTAIAGETIHRVIRYGPLCDLFVLDMRSFRGPNTAGLEEAPEGPTSAILGADQARWLADGLASSKALWKLVIADMPLGLVVADGAAIEAVANGDAGPPRGREHELARLLAELKARGVANVVWLTADVHYTAAHRYDPTRAIFGDFDPFWEFVSGPLHAGTFGPSPLDPTFGPELRFIKAPAPGEANLPPTAGLQFFGELEISAGGVLSVTLRDREGASLWSIDLPPDERL
ncbi:MAG: alkaline phosphatase D family protein [Myxococcales bacterium]|nr:alkaline phosphatase D family protein [Myxococcales bacterium]